MTAEVGVATESPRQGSVESTDSSFPNWPQPVVVEEALRRARSQ